MQEVLIAICSNLEVDNLLGFFLTNMKLFCIYVARDTSRTNKKITAYLLRKKENDVYLKVGIKGIPSFVYFGAGLLTKRPTL